ncbi:MULTISPECIES: hypothetical protein [Euryhalocaulis]|uniref:hypothetical protein n=1 Tax=Euryhalocaulis TaxID=1712422 RepID=UPI001267D668|nr:MULTISPECIES: hypothetical protein [Euryhalocaulis]MBA4801132.1 hypothetical protein [Euryhalocaulis sp.]
MNMKLVIAAAGAALAVSACAAQNEMAASGETKVAGDDQLICERVQTVGSRFSEEVCMTKAEMKEQRDDNEALMDRVRGQSNRTAAEPTGMTPTF